MSEEIYMEIRCVFSKRTTLFPIFSWILQVLFVKPYSHVLWYFEKEEMDLQYCYEAIGGGMRGANYKWWKAYSQALHYYAMPLTKEQWREVFLPTMRKNDGRPYGKLQILGMGWVLFVRFITCQKMRVRNPFGDGWVCSESILRMWLKLYSTETSQSYCIKIPGCEPFMIPKDDLKDIDSFTHADCDKFMGKYFERLEWDK